MTTTPPQTGEFKTHAQKVVTKGINSFKSTKALKKILAVPNNVHIVESAIINIQQNLVTRSCISSPKVPPRMQAHSDIAPGLTPYHTREGGKCTKETSAGTSKSGHVSVLVHECKVTPTKCSRTKMLKFCLLFV